MPLRGHFNFNRNRRIVELSCLYCHLFYLSFFRGREITFVPSINNVSAIPTCSFFVHQITLTHGEQLSTFSFPW